jgi:hypothetical protein
MRPIRMWSVAVATIAAAGVVGLPLLGAGEAGPGGASDAAVPGTTGAGTSLGDTTSVETTTSVVDTSVVDTSTSFPEATTTTLPPSPVVVAAAGDLSCIPGDPVGPTSCHAGAISDALLALPELEGFLALGDLQYRAGSLKDFQESYDLTYGRLKEVTHPAVGNHEYLTPGAAGYFDYFGERAGTAGEGWYSVDVGTNWHIVALNSNCSRVACGVGSAQELWLQADLAASERPCTVAFWHHPLFSSGAHHGSNPRTAPFWDALLADGAELVLTGHDHEYERFAPQLTDGTASDLGLRAFVVGTGGKSLHSFTTPSEANSEIRLETFGYLRLFLSDTGYDFEFVGEDGTVLDQGSGTCHGPAAPPPAP